MKIFAGMMEGARRELGHKALAVSFKQKIQGFSKIVEVVPQSRFSCSRLRNYSNNKT